MKITITITDNETGTADIKVEFDPAIDEEAPMTPAAYVALKMMKVIENSVKRASVEREAKRSA